MRREIKLSSDELLQILLGLKPPTEMAILDSCNRALGGSRYLIAGFEPSEIVEFDCQNQRDAFDALAFLNEKLDFYYNKNKFDADFQGACIAAFAYDLGLHFENIKPRAKEFATFAQPAATFAFYETLVVHDYLTQQTFAAGKKAAEFASFLEKQKPSKLEISTAKALAVITNFARSDYIAAVEKIKKHIAAGDIYQANLTQQLVINLTETFSPETMFWQLRKNHPAPFAAFIRRKNDCVVSASPERFLNVQNFKSNAADARIVTAQPIKGTRPRGHTAEEDVRLRRELERSAKDRAENVMIVDLLRNDIGRVCEFGSVRAEKLFEIETHPTLFHLVSTVRGKLRPDVSISELLTATFPCGSITGAPKIRAMQILDEIETAPRQLSMGAIGYFGFNGALDLNVAIRTAVVRGDKAVFNVGGGIVADSDPEAEYQESLLKAQALLAACGARI